VVGHGQLVIRVGGLLEFRPTPALDALLAHQAGDSLAADLPAALAQLPADPRAPVGLPARCMDRRDLLGKLCGLPRSLRRLPRLPRVVAAPRDLEDLAHHADGKVGLLRRDHFEGGHVSLAKKAAAFFKKSRSISTRFSSLRSRASSARSSVV